MSPATKRTAGAGNSHRARRWAQRALRPAAARVTVGALVLRPVEKVLKVFLRLGQNLRGRRALDRLLDGDTDDVAILGDADDLRQPLPADLQRSLIGLIPVGRHLRLGLHLRAVPGRA